VSNQSALDGFTATFIAALVIGYTPFQAPTQSTVVMALEQQTSSSNQTEIVVAQTPQERVTSNGLINSTLMPGTIEIGRYSERYMDLAYW
jgi:hypothetical protein